MHILQRVSGLGRGVGTPRFLCSLPAILHPRPWAGPNFQAKLDNP